MIAAIEHLRQICVLSVTVELYQILVNTMPDSTTDFQMADFNSTPTQIINLQSSRTQIAAGVQSPYPDLQHLWTGIDAVVQSLKPDVTHRPARLAIMSLNFKRENLANMGRLIDLIGAELQHLTEPYASK